MSNITIKGGRIRNTFSAIADGVIGQYQCVFAYTAGKVKLGNNTGLTQADIAGVSLQNLIDGQKGSFLVEGEIVNNTWGWSSGQELFVDESGNLTQTLPSNGRVICQVGVALSATKIYISIDKTIIKTS